MKSGSGSRTRDPQLGADTPGHVARLLPGPGARRLASREEASFQCIVSVVLYSFERFLSIYKILATFPVLYSTSL